MKKLVLIFITSLVLYGCNDEKSPLDTATQYFERIYDSSSYQEILEDNFDLDEKIQAVIAAPFATDAAIKNLLTGSGVLPIESVYLDGYKFKVLDINYSDLKFNGNNDAVYDYSVIIEITNTEGNIIKKEIQGELNLTLIKDMWKIQSDNLTNIDSYTSE